MTHPLMTRGAATLWLITLLAACGGGETPPPTAAPSEQAAMTQVPGKRALATAITVDAKALFDWAEYKYPTLFAKGPQNFPLVFGGVNYTIRAYPNGNYLGLTAGGDIYGLGPFTNQVLTPFGKLSDYVALVQGDSCLIYPGSCDPPPTGPANECVDPTMANPPTGFRTHLVYDYSTTSGNGETTLDSVVNGPSTFEGQSAFKVTTNVVSAFNAPGFSTTTNLLSTDFYQPVGNGLIQNLGGTSESDSHIPGLPTGNRSSEKYVHTPPDVGVEFALQVGQSVTKTVNITTTTILPIGTPVNSSSSTTTYTFEAKETISVLGRSFNTCRYRITSAEVSGFSITWYIVGKGVPAKFTSTSADETATTQLKPGSTYNGAAL